MRPTPFAPFCTSNSISKCVYPLLSTILIQYLYYKPRLPAISLCKTVAPKNLCRQESAGGRKAAIFLRKPFAEQDRFLRISTNGAGWIKVSGWEKISQACSNCVQPIARQRDMSMKRKRNASSFAFPDSSFTLRENSYIVSTISVFSVRSVSGT